MRNLGGLLAETVFGREEAANSAANTTRQPLPNTIFFVASSPPHLTHHQALPLSLGHLLLVTPSLQPILPYFNSLLLSESHLKQKYPFIRTLLSTLFQFINTLSKMSAKASVGINDVLGI
jgi:hypothetical protein